MRTDMTPEVIRAAERTKRAMDLHGSNGNYCDNLMMTAHILAHREDYDAEGKPLPIDEGFLKEGGGKWDDFSAAFQFRITGHERLFVRTNGQWWLHNHSTFGGTAGGKKSVRYRHEFRQLAEVVGLALLAAMGR